MNLLLSELEKRVLLGDGAMGTQLMLAGLEAGACGELWNLQQPDKVLAIQQAYVNAGSDCLLTNTFGANRLNLDRHGHGSDVDAINRAAVDIARRAFGTRQGFVIGDVGPFGGMIEPYGETPEDEVRSALLEQSKSLVAAGVDAIIIETQTIMEEVLIGIEAALEAGATCVIGSMAFDVNKDGTALRTMMGVSPEKAAEQIAKAGAHVIGMNCGMGMNMQYALDTVRRFRAVSGLPVMTQPNAGNPELVDGKVIYRELPEQMSQGIQPLVAAGAGIIGACCGSSPAHIAAFRKALG